MMRLGYMDFENRRAKILPCFEPRHLPNIDRTGWEDGMSHVKVRRRILNSRVWLLEEALNLRR